MANETESSAGPGNHILGALPQAEIDAIAPHLEPMLLDQRHVAYDVNTPIEYVYFPEDCVISLVSVMRDGQVVEVATVGNEGMIGLPLFLRARRTLGQAFCQVPGSAFRMKADAFVEFAAKGKLNDLMHRYTQALFAQVSQSAACNRLHLAEERFSRWILMTHDRVRGNDFALTQDFLSQMLGVRRATVSEVAAQAQRDGLIRYHRGHMTIVNRKGLEERACECYSIIQAEFEQLIGDSSKNSLSRARVSLPSFSRAGKATAGEAIPHIDRTEAGSPAPTPADNNAST
ncbi:MAG TPA: Crp/Fnr family transcriptional regulator [Polyangiaceae bacterium]|nr:Crp/Fnr family transcriptional regulator [Polyangiaceae bacterium]